VSGKSQKDTKERTFDIAPEVTYEAKEAAEIEPTLNSDASGAVYEVKSDSPMQNSDVAPDSTDEAEHLRQVSAKPREKDVKGDKCEKNEKGEKGGIFDLGKLFGINIGFEELLIIALILLLGKDGENEDIVVLLAILLFIN
jgi:hypothetical protein